MAEDRELTLETHPDGESRIGPMIATKVTGDDVQANLSAVGSVSAKKLSATGSALGMTNVDGDATITASASPLVIARGDTTIQQSYASAVIVGGGSFTRIRQSGAPVMVGKTVEVSQSGAVVIAGGEVSVKKSWVGVVLAPKAEISDDSHVVVSQRSALIIAAAILGGFGLVALALGLGARSMMRRRRSSRMAALMTVPAVAGTLHQLQSRARSMPSLHELQSMAGKALPSMHELQSKVNLAELADTAEKLIRRRA